MSGTAALSSLGRQAGRGGREQEATHPPHPALTARHLFPYTTPLDLAHTGAQLKSHLLQPLCAESRHRLAHTRAPFLPHAFFTAFLPPLHLASQALGYTLPSTPHTGSLILVQGQGLAAAALQSFAQLAPRAPQGQRVAALSQAAWHALPYSLPAVG
jgi:hypothetical protein